MRAEEIIVEADASRRGFLKTLGKGAAAAGVAAAGLGKHNSSQAASPVYLVLNANFKSMDEARRVAKSLDDLNLVAVTAAVVEGKPAVIIDDGGPYNDVLEASKYVARWTEYFGLKNVRTEWEIIGAGQVKSGIQWTDSSAGGGSNKKSIAENLREEIRDVMRTNPKVIAALYLKYFLEGDQAIRDGNYDRAIQIYSGLKTYAQQQRHIR